MEKPHLASLIPARLWGEIHERGPAITCLQLWDSPQYKYSSRVKKRERKKSGG